MLGQALAQATGVCSAPQYAAFVQGIDFGEGPQEKKKICLLQKSVARNISMFQVTFY